MRSRGMGPLRPGLVALLLSLFLALASCTSDGGYYGSAYYDDFGVSDPWYHGGGPWYDDDIAVPPGARPRPPRPEHPIARPPMAAPRPMPSIPSRPRPSRR